MKEVASLVIMCCAGVGCCTGGVLNAYDSFRYDRAINDPSFVYLVDEAGNPVSQKVEGKFGSSNG